MSKKMYPHRTRGKMYPHRTRRDWASRVRSTVVMAVIRHIDYCFSVVRFEVCFCGHFLASHCYVLRCGSSTTTHPSNNIQQSLRSFFFALAVHPKHKTTRLCVIASTSRDRQLDFVLLGHPPPWPTWALVEIRLWHRLAWSCEDQQLVFRV